MKLFVQLLAMTSGQRFAVTHAIAERWRPHDSGRSVDWRRRTSVRRAADGRGPGPTRSGSNLAADRRDTAAGQRDRAVLPARGNSWEVLCHRKDHNHAWRQQSSRQRSNRHPPGRCPASCKAMT